MPFINTLGTFSFPGKFLAEPTTGSNFLLNVKRLASPSTGFVQPEDVLFVPNSGMGTPYVFQDQYGNGCIFTGGSTSNSSATQQDLIPRLYRISPDGSKRTGYFVYSGTTTSAIYLADAMYFNNHLYVAIVMAIPKVVSNPTRIVYDCRTQISKVFLDSLDNASPNDVVWTTNLLAGDNVEAANRPSSISIGYDDVNDIVSVGYQLFTGPVMHITRGSDGLVLNTYNRRPNRQVVAINDNGTESLYGGNVIFNLDASNNITTTKNVTLTYNSNTVQDLRTINGVSYGFSNNVLFRHVPTSTSVTAFAYTLGGNALPITDITTSQNNVYFLSGNRIIKLDNNLNYLDGIEVSVTSAVGYAFNTNNRGRIGIINDRIMFVGQNMGLMTPTNMLFAGTGQYTFMTEDGYSVTVTLSKLSAVVRNTATISKTIQTTTNTAPIITSGWTGQSFSMSNTTLHLDVKAI